METGDSRRSKFSTNLLLTISKGLNWFLIKKLTKNVPLHEASWAPIDVLDLWLLVNIISYLVYDTNA